MKNRHFIPSVNFHLWQPCNMRCKFCFATFQDVKQTILPKGHLPKNQALEVVKQIADFGFEKITFAGGEPLLCPWLSELIKEAKHHGLTTMVVTNGSKLTEQFLIENQKHLDWIAISIDSLNETTNFNIGRAVVGKNILMVNHYKNLINAVKHYGYGLKINTVVNMFNYKEDFNDFIKETNPKRWKVLQVLPIKGQNDMNVNDLEISEKQFNYFIDKHKIIKTMIPESNKAMKGSYVMVDPAGRFFDNELGVHNYSKPILEIGVEDALKSVNYDVSKFIMRRGIYNWN